MIHGESYKPIVAEAAKKSANKIYNRIMVTHLLMDDEKENRIGGAVGFNMRTGDYHVFKGQFYFPFVSFLLQQQLVKHKPNHYYMGRTKFFPFLWGNCNCRDSTCY